MSGFTEYLRALIASEGPQPVERVMADALGHPAQGYYTTRDPFGPAGDFVTAPEISQMFGELIGLWCVATYEQMGAPKHPRLIELGPGRGTLMADALRAIGCFDRLRAALEIHLVETSPVLRRTQRATLGDRHMTWHGRIDDVPAGPAIILANELFDALPVRQFMVTPEGWRERLVTLGDDGTAFRFVAAARELAALPAWLPPAARLPVDTIAEASPAGEALAATIGSRLASSGGAALLIDYGHVASAPGETLQAVRAHRSVPVLDFLGDADLTAHVDFAALACAAESAGARAWGPVGQGRFLTTLGIEARAARLATGATSEQASGIQAALHRLTASDAMGALFKVLALTSRNAPAPAGFESTGATMAAPETEAVHD